MTDYPTSYPGPTHPRVFGTLSRWPLVPSSELYRLQDALRECVELTGSDTAHELLALISGELAKRAAEPPGISPATAPGSDVPEQPESRRAVPSAAVRWTR